VLHNIAIDWNDDEPEPHPDVNLQGPDEPEVEVVGERV
jgi:hypothetical protein